MEKFQTSDIPKSPRIQKLVDALYEHMPVIESSRAKLLTESYKETEGEPIITRQEKNLMEKKLLMMLHLRLLKISWNELNF